jgi:hypothetical protein
MSTLDFGQLRALDEQVSTFLGWRTFQIHCYEKIGRTEAATIPCEAHRNQILF